MLARRLKSRKKAEEEKRGTRGRDSRIVGANSTDKEGRKTETARGDREDEMNVPSGSGETTSGSGDVSKERMGRTGIGGLNVGTSTVGTGNSDKKESVRRARMRGGIIVTGYLFLCLLLCITPITPATRAVLETFADTLSPYAGSTGNIIMGLNGAAAPGAASTPRKCRPRSPHRIGCPRLLPRLLAPPRRGPPHFPPATMLLYRYLADEHVQNSNWIAREQRMTKV